MDVSSRLFGTNKKTLIEFEFELLERRERGFEGIRAHANVDDCVLEPRRTFS